MGRLAVFWPFSGRLLASLLAGAQGAREHTRPKGAVRAAHSPERRCLRVGELLVSGQDGRMRFCCVVVVMAVAVVAVVAVAVVPVAMTGCRPWLVRQVFNFLFNKGYKLCASHAHRARNKDKRVERSSPLSGFQLCDIDPRQSGKVGKLLLR